MGSLVGDRSVVSDASNPDNYHDIIKNTPVTSFIAQDAMTPSLDILIKDIGGKDLDHIIKNGVQLPARKVLLEFNTIKMTQRHSSDAEHVLVSQETVYKPKINPTHASINNQDLLEKIEKHLARKRKVTCHLSNLTLPTKFVTASNYLIITVTGLNFSNKSYVDNIEYYAMGFVNLSKIENFESIQTQNVYHSVDFRPWEIFHR